MQPPFDLYAGLFSVAEVSEISGVPRPIIDVWVKRKVLTPTRRQRPADRPPAIPNKRRPARRPGRPLFSCRDVFKACLVRMLAEFELGSTDSSELASEIEKTKIATDAVAETDDLADPIKVAEIVSGGEWMWACARSIESIERGSPLIIYGYAARIDGKWLFDMHVGAHGAEPCFGWGSLNVFIPVSDLFAHVYAKCKEVVGAGPHGG